MPGIGREDLIAVKLASGREQDLKDVAAIRRGAGSGKSQGADPEGGAKGANRPLHHSTTPIIQFSTVQEV